MIRHRVSIGGLMAGLVLVAVGLAALRSGSKGWFQVMYGLTLFTLATATLLARYRDGRAGAFWSGFALFGWVYLLLGVGNPIGIVNPLAAYNLGETFHRPTDLLPLGDWIHGLLYSLSLSGWLPERVPNVANPGQTSDRTHRIWVIQFLVVLLVGLLGGLWGRWLAGRAAPPLAVGSADADHG